MSDEKILNGILGEMVRFYAPYTEADPLGHFLSLMLLCSTTFGRSPYLKIGTSEIHFLNDFGILVGATTTGAKGTSTNIGFANYQSAFELINLDQENFEAVDRLIVPVRISSGAASGEGLIKHISDAVYGYRKKGEITEQYIIDAGVEDKRCLFEETEFGAVLKRVKTDGSILSPIIRKAWDGKDLEAISKYRMKATAPHISILGHITYKELRTFLSDSRFESEIFNGFLNRFTWIETKVSKELAIPEEPPKDEEKLLLRKLAKGILYGAKFKGEVKMSSDALDLWKQEYRALRFPKYPGVLEGVLARGAAKVRRWSAVFCLMDCRPLIEAQDLEKALALWDQNIACCKRIFGGKTGNVIADKIMKHLIKKEIDEANLANTVNAVTRTPFQPVTDSYINDTILSKNTNLYVKERALASLIELGYLEECSVATGRGAGTGYKLTEHGYGIR